MDTFVDGHHISYLNGIIKNSNDSMVFVLPKSSDINSKYKQIVIEYDVNKRNLKYDITWIDKVYKIAEQEKPDVVHFLYGDILYRSLGIGLNKFKKFKTVVTFHVIKDDFKHHIGMKLIANKIDQCVVHTQSLLTQITSWGIKNITQIEYPCFFPINEKDKQSLREEYAIPATATVFLAIGGTREYKGLNYLLEALNYVQGNFHLLIAGSEEFFTQEYIESHIQKYYKRVTMRLHQLTDQEFMDCLSVSDWIVLPYKKSFTGASGPLAEGVTYGKHIIGVNSGSIGNLIKEYHLGFTFEAENIPALAEVLKMAIDVEYSDDDRYLNYKLSLSPNTFAHRYQELYRRL